MPDHHQRRHPGSPVYVDDEALYRRLWLSRDGEIATRDELLAPVDQAADGNGQVPSKDALSGEDTTIPKEMIKSFCLAGSSIYDRDQLYGDEELSLNILADRYDEVTARR